MMFASLFAAEDIDPARSVHWLWPEQAELIYGTIASLLIFGALCKFAGPAIKKAMADRTQGIQTELDESAAAKTEAEAEAARIRQAAGDIDAERQRLFADADAAGRARCSPTVEPGSSRRSPNSKRVPRPTSLRPPVGSTTNCGPRSPASRTLRPSSCCRRASRRPDPAGPDRVLHRTSRSELMSDARIDGYARALFEVARAEGTIDEVEDELFRFARSFESSDELRNALTDEQVPAGKRQAIVEDLLGGKATPTTTQLVSMVVGSGRGRDLPAIVDKLVARAASAKDLSVAEVRSAVALTDDQQDRLKAALANATGKQVNLKVIVDPSVLGGLVATVGDTVIDGSVRTRVDQLKSRL